MQFSVRHFTKGVYWFLLYLASADALAEAGANKQLPRLLILGLGRVGLECGLLAKQHLLSLETVIGTVRSTSEEYSDGILRIPFHEKSQVLEHLEKATHVLWTIPLQRERDEYLEQILDLLFLQKSSRRNDKNHLEWIGFVSTTGVYGNHDGALVTEESPLLCTPESNAHLYRQVEQRFLEVGGQIFRCAGIYDGTRSALHTVYKSGKPPRSSTTPRGTVEEGMLESESPTNRIHTYDVARAIVSSMQLSSSGKDGEDRQPRIYNLADDEPAERAVVLQYAADLLESIGVNLTVNSKETNNSNTQSKAVALTKRERRRLSDRKLVSNKRMKSELLSRDFAGLAYPSYRKGLDDILRNKQAEWWQ